MASKEKYENKYGKIKKTIPIFNPSGMCGYALQYLGINAL
jgi:hypothetical protein